MDHLEWANKTSCSEALCFSCVGYDDVFVKIGEIWSNEGLGREIVILGNHDYSVKVVHISPTFTKQTVSSYSCQIFFEGFWKKGRLGQP